jgi:hypothetical protein
MSKKNKKIKMAEDFSFENAKFLNPFKKYINYLKYEEI